MLCLKFHADSDHSWTSPSLPPKATAISPLTPSEHQHPLRTFQDITGSVGHEELALCPTRDSLLARIPVPAELEAMRAGAGLSAASCLTWVKQHDGTKASQL